MGNAIAAIIGAAILAALPGYIYIAYRYSKTKGRASGFDWIIGAALLPSFICYLSYIGRENLNEPFNPATLIAAICMCAAGGYVARHRYKKAHP